MENSQTSNLTKQKTYHERQAIGIDKLLTSISYEKFSDKEMEQLIFLTNYVRTIPANEIENFRIKKYTEAWGIFKRLKTAFSHRKVEEMMESLLVEYEKYEVLVEWLKD